jgi:hypothetical protein
LDALEEHAEVEKGQGEWRLVVPIGCRCPLGLVPWASSQGMFLEPLRGLVAGGVPADWRTGMPADWRTGEPLLFLRAPLPVGVLCAKELAVDLVVVVVVVVPPLQPS